MQRFEAYEDRYGNWRWRLWAANEKIIASSGESFSSQAAALRAAEGVRTTAAEATVSITPGLGVKAALRLRALLGAGDSSGHRANPQRRRLRPAASSNSNRKLRRARRIASPARSA